MSNPRPRQPAWRAWLGRFVDERLLYGSTHPEAEERFQEHARQIMRLWFRVLAWATILLGLLSWPTDYWQFANRPEGVAAFRIWRIGLLALAVGGLVGYRFVSVVRRRPRPFISVAMMLASGLGGLAMAQLGGLDEPWFYTAYAIPSLPALLLWPLPQRLMVTSLVALAWVAAYFGGAPRHIDYAYLLNPVLFLTFLIILSTAFGHVMYHLFRLFHFERERLAGRTEQLEALDRLKSDFFANLSHELRTPLTLILGSFRMLGKGAHDDVERRTVEAGLRNGARLLLLINDLLDLAKSESGAAWLNRRRVDVAAIVRQVVANFDSGLDDGALVAEGLDAPVPAEVDPSQLKKILYNLLSNAMKFTEPGRRRIRVILRADGDQLEFEVRDNGIGIPADQVDRVFDRFTQVEGGAARRFEGSGIGLALVDQVVQAHGGTIRLESAVGVGTTFRVRLPRGAWAGTLGAVDTDEMVDDLNRLGLSRSGMYRVDPVSATTTELVPTAGLVAPIEPDVDAPLPTGETSPRAARQTVLLAEDNDDLRSYVASLLQARYRVLPAADGSEALETALRELPDLILADVMMPRMSGLDLLKAVRSEPSLTGVPFVFLTARTGTGARVEALEGGADDYVAKPFDEDELLARIDNLLRSRAQEREVVRLNEALRQANARLETRIEQQMGELIRTGQLKRFLPPVVAEQILRGEIDLDHHLDRRTATILFADIVGYTEITSRLDPPDLAAVLDDWVREMTAVVVEHEGFVDKFIGDAVMAVFTADGGDELPARVTAAAHAAVAMSDRLRVLNARWKARALDVDVRLRIGLHTGPVVLGVFGDAQRQTFTVVGTAVNIAARLQHEARAGEILASDATRAHLMDDLGAEPRGQLTLKGIDLPVATFRIFGPPAHASDRA